MAALPLQNCNKKKKEKKKDRKKRKGMEKSAELEQKPCEKELK